MSSTTYPLATLGVTINAAGVSAPTLADIVNSLVTSFQTIYGSDAVLTPSTQDYQNIAIRAMAQNDTNNAIIAAILGFMPGYAQGVNLSNLVLINGLQREASSPSTATLTIAGVVGTVIPAGIVQDQNGYLWALPLDVVIPNAGLIAVTATCQTAGAISAAPNTITTIQNLQIGWQTATNPAAAVPGAPVELDAELRQRQQASTGISAQTPLSAIAATIANIPGVTRSTVYENQTATTDGNGVPSHSIAAIVLGGSATAIAQAIEAKKAPGTGTYGTTSEIVLDPEGVPITINFFQLALAQIYVSVTILPLTGYVAATATSLVTAIVDFINGLAIGQQVYYSWLWAPAQQDDDTNNIGKTYVVTSLTVSTVPNPTGTANIPIAFNSAAVCSAANVVVTVT